MMGTPLTAGSHHSRWRANRRTQTSPHQQGLARAHFYINFTQNIIFIDHFDDGKNYSYTKLSPASWSSMYCLLLSMSLLHVGHQSSVLSHLEVTELALERVVNTLVIV